MELFSLLDRNEQNQLRIFNFLMERDEWVFIKEITEKLNISPYIFDTCYLELEHLLIETNDNKIILSRNTDQVYLKSNTNFSTKNLNFEIFKRSLFYQIIGIIYQYNNLTVTKIAQILKVSEPTIYRYVSLINKNLKEFNLKIKNGDIVGSDLQKCYFFYQIFWNTIPLDIIDSDFYTILSMNLITFLENKLNIDLSHAEKLQITLWLTIVQHLNTKQTFTNENSILEEINIQYQENPIYILIRDSYFTALSHTALHGSDIVAAYLFIFLNSIISVHNFKIENQGNIQWPTLNKKVVKINNEFLQLIRKNMNVSDYNIPPFILNHWSTMISKVHGSFLYFNGICTLYNPQLISHKLGEVSFNNKLESKLIKSFQKNKETTLTSESKYALSIFYNHLLNQIKFYSKPQISVGILFNSSTWESYSLFEGIFNKFNLQYNLKFNFANSKEQYDLLLTDSLLDISLYKYDKLYVINDLFTNHDNDTLTQILNELQDSK